MPARLFRVCKGVILEPLAHIDQVQLRQQRFAALLVLAFQFLQDFFCRKHCHGLHPQQRIKVEEVSGGCGLLRRSFRCLYIRCRLPDQRQHDRLIIRICVRKAEI